VDGHVKIPAMLTVLALEQDTDLPLEGLAIVIELFARRKNNYTIGPAISDSAGQVRFTKEECERSVNSDREMFIMDYVDDIEGCKPYLEVRLHPPDRIAQMLRQYQTSPTFWGRRFQNPDRLFQALSAARNASYEPTSIRVDEAQILSNPNVSLRVRRLR
jgi:hypothetical protein